jgi:plastocyanin domain-containing protein
MKKRMMISLVAALLVLVGLSGGGNAVFANPNASGGKNAVKKNGFTPSTIEVEKGYPLTLIFRRATKEGCGNKVVFPSLNISRNLPVGKNVTVKFTPDKTGDISFTCGMGMMRGSIVVE